MYYEREIDSTRFPIMLFVLGLLTGATLGLFAVVGTLLVMDRGVFLMEPCSNIGSGTGQAGSPMLGSK